MKYVILHGEGLVDDPYAELEGKTPLRAADTPNMDRLARSAELGLVAFQPEGVVQSDGLTSLLLLGYDPRKFASGPAPFEAIGLGIALKDHDVAFRCSMVTLRPQPQAGGAKAGPVYPEIMKLGPHLTMEDDTADGITTEEARELIEAVNEQLGSETIQFYPGTGHRHFMVWVGGKAKATCVDPREVVGRSIGQHVPAGDGADVLRKLMEASLIILGSHPVNDQRVEARLRPANCLWLWGQGKAPNLPNVRDRFNVSGSVSSSSDLVRGIGVCSGLESIGADEHAEIDRQDFQARASRALRELEKKDFLYLHVQLPDESVGSEGPTAKRELLEQFDRHMIGVMMEGLKKWGSYRVLLVGERCSSSRKPGDGMQLALYALARDSDQAPPSDHPGFSEADAEATQRSVRDPTTLVTKLLARG